MNFTLSPSFSHFLSLSLLLSPTFSLFLFLSFSLSLFFSFSLFLFLSLSLSRSLSLSFSHSLCLIIFKDDSVRLATVLQENAVLKSEMEMLKMKCKNLIEENKRLRQASVNIVSIMLYKQSIT